MARRHALVSLRHDSPSFIIIIIKYYYLKRDDKLENLYDVWWLLYQRIIKTALVDFSDQGPGPGQLLQTVSSVFS